jgi:3'-5' exonuclease
VIVVDLARVPVAMLAAVFAQERKWLVHNGLFDVRFVTAAGLRWAGRLFDTMLMSQLLGAGTPEGNLGQSGLGAVVQRYLGLQLPKALQRSQWDGPLTPTQCGSTRFVMPRSYGPLPTASRPPCAWGVSSAPPTSKMTVSRRWPGSNSRACPSMPLS